MLLGNLAVQALAPTRLAGFPKPERSLFCLVGGFRQTTGALYGSGFEASTYSILPFAIQGPYGNFESRQHGALLVRDSG